MAPTQVNEPVMVQCTQMIVYIVLNCSLRFIFVGNCWRKGLRGDVERGDKRKVFFVRG